MKENFISTTWGERELNKIGLDTFTHNRNNIIDYPLDTPIEDVKGEINKAYAKHNEWIEFEEKNPERFKKLEELAKLKGRDLLQPKVRLHSKCYLS